MPNHCQNYYMAADQENESTLRIFRHTLLLEKDSGGTNPAGFPDSFVRSVSHRLSPPYKWYHR
ncbi:Uncharacterised protein [Segatella copri]|nr:Uncharacterised protein [Segatella copri]